MSYLILTINPGSTSTKTALFRDKTQIFNENINHSQKDFDGYGDHLKQIPMRKALVLKSLSDHGFEVSGLSAVMGRGGLLPPISTGGYRVNKRMLDTILNEEIPWHESNLGAVLAYEIAQLANVPAYIYDAVSAADFPPIAKISGFKEIERRSFSHVLNSRAAAIRYARSLGKEIEDLNLLVTHLGGGITTGVYEKGKLVDSLSDDNGPFAPERSGGAPLLDVIDLCYSGGYSKEEMIKKVRGSGGLKALLGTSDGREIMCRIANGDKYAADIMGALAYQIAKGIGLLAPVLKGNCDAIIITGSLAFFESLVNDVKGYVGFLAPVEVIPGEYEMEAMALGGLRILLGQETVNEY